MANGSSPYNLFLILILLVYGFDPNIKQKVDAFKTAVESISKGFGNLHSTINTLSNDFGDVQLMLMNLNKQPNNKETN